MGKTAEDILIENDTFALKREYKRALENLNSVKRETADILQILEKSRKDHEQKQEDLKNVVNEISQEKLEWAQHRAEQLREIENKMSEAQNVIKRKSELNAQEELLRRIDQENTEKLNEQRRLELSNKREKTLLDSEKTELGNRRKKIIETQNKFNRDKQQLKEELINFIKQWEMKL